MHALERLGYKKTQVSSGKRNTSLLTKKYKSMGWSVRVTKGLTKCGSYTQRIIWTKNKNK